jgi:cyclopropane fatty-acyl-phospholipid synthase-like methyltransferase
MSFAYQEGYFYSDLDNWNKKMLRSNDQFPALCYAFGIYDLIECNTLEDQLQFLNNYKTRTPNHVLEIGPGRGEISCVLSKLGIPVTAVDIAINIQNWFDRTGKQFFGDEFIPPKVIETNVKNFVADFSKFDTVLMVESIEHILEEEFEPVWDNICKQFSGLMCIANHPGMHPIAIGSGWPDAEKMHCRIIDDELFDNMSLKAKRTVYRKTSHFVLEF